MNEIEFSLPIGFIDRFGICHKSGRMRLAKVSDEIMFLNDERVLSNKCYLGILLLSRVITQLGTVTDINPNMIEQMYAIDIDFLQDLYMDFNSVVSNNTK